MARTKEFDGGRALDDAVRVFWEKGYEATSIQDLVNAIGVNGASLYQSFGGKRELFLKALERFAACDRNIAQAATGIAPGLARIRAALRLAGEQAAADTRGCMIVNAIVEQAAQDCEMQAMGGAARQRLEDFFCRIAGGGGVPRRDSRRPGPPGAGPLPDQHALRTAGHSQDARWRPSHTRHRRNHPRLYRKRLNPLSPAAINCLYRMSVPEKKGRQEIWVS
jgi:AcrR family transcriptional regulator